MRRFSLNPISRNLQQRRWPLALAMLAPGWALANPIGGQVVGGAAAISAPDAGTVRIDQASAAAIINWQQFSVGSQEYVVFNQPSSSATTLNRVLGGNPSEILGRLSANGRVFLINPSGVMFGQGARVDVGGIVASTLDLADTDFMSGRYVFARGSAGGTVSNAGQISTSPGGMVVLAGDRVQNTGLIQAQLGDVVLASGSAMTLGTDAAGLVSFVVDGAALSDTAGVTNVGEIIAAGGSVLMTAETARTLTGSAVNNRGRVSAQSIQEHAGSIVLSAEGGDVSQGGTLDASGAGGAAGGTVRLLADRDVTLESGSQTLATGSSGGDVRAIAQGTLSYASGARMNVSALSLTGAGGFAELSGHQRVRIRDAVTLGRRGHLLIDPTDVTIGAGGDIDEVALENQLRSATEGSMVTVQATNSIRLLDLADNALDGRTTATGLGGGLELLGGSISFDDTFGDSILVDSSLHLQAGSGQGVFIGGLASGFGDITITGETVQADRAIDAGGQVVIASLNGFLGTADISAGSNIQVTAGGTGNDVVTGSLTAIQANSQAVSVLVSGASVDVRGDVTVIGGGANLADTSFPPNAASLSLLANTGAMTVRGGVTVIGDPFAFDNSGTGFTESGTAGGVSVFLTGDSVSIGEGLLPQKNIAPGGGLSVSGRGDVFTHLIAGNGGISIAGQTLVIADAATRNYADSNGLTITERHGTASFTGTTGGRFDAHGITVVGPNADAFIAGNDVRLHEGMDPEFGATGVALAVNALPGGSGAADGAFYERRQNNVTQITSTYGAASAHIEAFGGDASTPSVAAEGLVSVVGPRALLQLSGPGLMLIGNDVAGANIEIGGSGFAIDGDWSQLGFGHGPGSGQTEGAKTVGNDDVPVLSQGALVWGDAVLRVDNGSPDLRSGPLSVFGSVLMSGIGQVEAQLSVEGLSTFAVGSETVGLFLDAGSSGPGLVAGTARSFVTTINGSSYQATREISDGFGGAASYGNARLDLDLGSGNLDLPVLSIAGLSSEADIDGGASLTFGDIEILGTEGVGRARYVDQTTFVPLSGGPAIGPTTTEIVGGQNVLSIGFEGQAPNSISADSIVVAGDGAAALVANAGSIFVNGAIEVSASTGRFTSNDPTVSGNAPNLGSDAILSLSGEGPVTASSIAVNSVGNAHVGGNYQVAGAFSVNTGAGRLDQAIPGEIVEFRHPLQGNESAAQPAEFPVPLPRLMVAASNIGLSFGTIGSSLIDSQLVAGNSLNVDGHNGIVNIGNGVWTANNLNISNATLTGNTVSLNGGNLNQLSGVTVTGSSVSVTGNTVNVSNSALRATGATQVVAGSALQLSGVAINQGVTSTAGRTVTLASGGHLTYSGNLAGDVVLMHAGLTPTLGAGGLTVNGSVTGQHVDLSATQTIGTGGQALTLDANALDVHTTSGDVAFGQASVTVGTGVAFNGHDPLLLAGTPAALRPATPGPNGAFIAPGLVDIGAIELVGGYLFIRAHTAALDSIATNGTFFYNFRPFLDSAVIPLGNLNSFNLPPGNNTFAFGGTGYAGDIRFDQSSAAKLAGTENYVFMTTGTIVGLNTLNTTGDVVVIDGVVGPPPGPGPGPEVPPVEHTDEQEAIDAQLAASNMSGTGTISQSSSIENQYGDEGGATAESAEGGDFAPMVSMVEESSAPAADLQCR